MHAASTVCFVAVACWIVLTLVSGETAFPKHGYFKPEKSCNTKGGLCILDELCDSPKKDVAGCPDQRHKGAVCCDQLPKNETRCEKLGGSCFLKADCRRDPIDKAKDCASGSVCCLLE